jgi:hypothetical protein
MENLPRASSSDEMPLDQEHPGKCGFESVLTEFRKHTKTDHRPSTATAILGWRRCQRLIIAIDFERNYGRNTASKRRCRYSSSAPIF